MKDAAASPRKTLRQVGVFTQTAFIQKVQKSKRRTEYAEFYQEAAVKALQKTRNLGRSRVYRHGVSLPPPLSKEEELRLTLLFTNADDSPAARETAEQAKNTLIEHNLRLVVYIAKKFENTGVCIEDLISIGTIGLIKAVNTFRADRNIKLATYASRCIENEILMHLRKTVKQKLEVSLDEPLNVDWDGNELLLGDILGTDGDVVGQGIEDEVDRQLLHIALNKLGAREKRIIELRFGLNGCREYTQKQVADMLGISQSYISRLEKKIINELYKEITAMS